MRVTGSGASSGGSWRRLRFNGNTEQSVLLLDASKTPEYGALAFGSCVDSSHQLLECSCINLYVRLV